MMAARTRIAVVGISGRMGQEILAVSAEDAAIELVAGVSRHREPSGGPPRVSRLDELSAEQIDVLIDFSLPDLFDEVCAWCATHEVALVSGVTGISDAHKTSLSEAATKTPILWAPNMSLGVAVMTEMLKALRALEGFEFQIEEIHHKRKKDKPSGTALFLQENLKAIVGEVPPPLALRGGGVFGIHKLWAMGDEETITIEHTALNRKVFARGALRAARWIAGRPPGLFTLSDVVRS